MVMEFGMSQTGADALAKQGYKYNDIIKHYYVGTEITNIKFNWLLLLHEKYEKSTLTNSINL